MTRAQLVAAAQLYYNEPTTSARITTANWQSFCDTIYQEVCRDCRAYPLSGSQNTANGTRTYMVPLAMVGIRKGGVYLAAVGQLRGPLNLEELSVTDAVWRATTGTPTSWYFADDVVTSGSDTSWGLGLYPTPTAAASLTLMGWGIPAALSGDSSVPTMPTAHHETLVWGMCWLAAVRDLDRRGQNRPKLEVFLQEYQGRKAALGQHMLDVGMEGWALGPPGYALLTREGAK